MSYVVKSYFNVASPADVHDRAYRIGSASNTSLGVQLNMYGYSYNTYAGHLVIFDHMNTGNDFRVLDKSNQSILSNDRFYHYFTNQTFTFSVLPMFVFDMIGNSPDAVLNFVQALRNICFGVNNYYYQMVPRFAAKLTYTISGCVLKSNSLPSATTILTSWSSDISGSGTLPGATFYYPSATHTFVYDAAEQVMFNSVGQGSGTAWNPTLGIQTYRTFMNYAASELFSGSTNTVLVLGSGTDTDVNAVEPIQVTITNSTDTEMYIAIKSVFTFEPVITTVSPSGAGNVGGTTTWQQAYSAINNSSENDINDSTYYTEPFPTTFSVVEIFGPFVSVYMPSANSISAEPQTLTLPYLFSKDIGYHAPFHLQYNNGSSFPLDYAALVTSGSFSPSGSGTYNFTNYAETTLSTSNPIENIDVSIYAITSNIDPGIFSYSLTLDYYGTDIDVDIDVYPGFNIGIYSEEAYDDTSSTYSSTSDWSNSFITYGTYSSSNLVSDEISVSPGDNYFYLRPVFIEDETDYRTVYDYRDTLTSGGFSYTSGINYGVSASLSSGTLPPSDSHHIDPDQSYSNFVYSSNLSFAGNTNIYKLYILVADMSQQNVNNGDILGTITIESAELNNISGSKTFQIPLKYYNPTTYLTGISLKYGTSSSSTAIGPSITASSSNNVAPGPVPMYLHLQTVPNPSTATEKEATMTVSYSNGASGSNISNSPTTIGDEEYIQITAGGTVTVSYTYYLSSSSSTTSSYTFYIPKPTGTGGTSFSFSVQPGPNVTVSSSSDYFTITWSGDETWNSSLSSSDPGYVHFDFPSGCSIKSGSPQIDGNNKTLKVYYNASSDEQSSVRIKAYLRTYNGEDVSIYSQYFNIVDPLNGIDASCTTYNWGNASSNNIVNKTSSIIWYGSSGISLGFKATSSPSGKSIYFNTQTGDNSSSLVSSSYTASNNPSTVNVSLSSYNSNRVATYAVFTDSNSSINSGIYAGFKFIGCQYTENFPNNSLASNYSITSTGNPLYITIEYNGDECDNEISFSTPSVSKSGVITCQADSHTNPTASTFGSVTYEITPNSNLMTTTTVTLFNIYCTGKGGRVPSSGGASTTITVTIPEVYYRITVSVDASSGYKSKVYGLEKTRLKIHSGGFVTSGTLTLPNNVQYSVNGTSGWTSGPYHFNNFDNSNNTYVFIRNITSSVLGEQTISVTADQYDAGVRTSGYGDTCTVTFGQISYSVNTYNGLSARGSDIRKDTVYIGDMIEFIATFEPSLNSSDPSIFWSSVNDLGSVSMLRWSSGYSNENDDYILQGTVTDTSPEATFNYSNDDGNYYNFSFDTVRDRSVDTNALKVPGGTLVIKGIHTTPPTLRDSSIDIPISGTTIVSIDDASFVGITGQDANLSKATDASLSLWINNTTLWSSVKDAPDSTAGYNYTIVLTGTNDLGDTVVNNSAGILHWKIGRDNFVFSSDPSTASVVGSANKTATFNVVCSYKDNEVIHYCQDVSIASNSGSAWCNASIVNNETSYTVTITTTAKNYTLNNKTATIVLSTKWDESQGETETINIIFIQEPLLVGVTFNLSIKNDSDNNTIINSNTKSLSTTYKTRGSYSKEYTIECIREERETINDASAEVTVSCKLATGSTANNVNGFSRSIMSPGNGQSDYFRITSSDNSGDDGQDRSAQYILITNHQGSNTLETSELAANYNVTYQVTVSQEGCRYSNFTLKINGETASSVDFGKSSRAGTNVEIPIVCTYIKTVDNTTETKQGQWYPIYDSLPAWLTSIDPASNTNVSDRNLKFTVISNADTESRDYTLSINTSFNGYGSAVTRTLHIIQSGTSTEFVPSTKIVDASTTSFTVDITSDDSWALVGYENRPNWITSVTPTANNVPNAEEVYDSSVNVVLAEHFSLTAANDYVKYRTTTNDRTATITAESSSNVNTSLGITQQGYSWSKTCNYPPVINLTSGQVKFTFTVASNYQIKLTGTERLTIPAEGIPGPSFNSTDGAGVVNSLTYDVSIKCNASASPKESIITILQDRIADEDDLNTSGSAYYQSNIITVKQPAASYTRYGSLQIIHDGNVVTPIENNDYGKVEFASAGNGATQIITVRSELGGWYLDSSSEAYLNSPESWITFRKNGEDVRGDRGFEENDSSAFKNVDIAIKCNTWNDVHNDRSVYLTFVHDVSSNIIAKLQVFQKKSDVQFALVASNDASLNGSTDLGDIISLLKERKINDPITSGYLLSAPIENEAVSLSYYLYYYIGGADKEDISQPITDIFKKVYENYVSIKSQFPSDCISAIEWTILSPEGNINPLDPTNYANGYWPAIPPECDWSDFNSTRVANINSEKIYKINLRIAKNENVYEKLHELKINSEANNSLEVKIQLLQPGATYSADFAFIDPTTIGEWSSRQNAYIIPVYGGSYPITVRNKLRYDTISIVNIYIDDNNTTTNVDETDFSNWASFKYLNSNGDYQDFDPNNPVILKEDVQGEDTANQQFMIVINPYTKKEGEETANDISNDRNKKLYRVYFVATSSSKPTTEITKVVTNSTATMEIVGVQESMDLRKTTWKLISDETRQDERTGSFKIFARTDISDGQNRILYSNDTGYTLINYNGSKVVENIAAEEDVIKDMFESTLLEDTQAALDERIGVRIYGNN